MYTVYTWTVYLRVSIYLIFSCFPLRLSQDLQQPIKTSRITFGLPKSESFCLVRKEMRGQRVSPIMPMEIAPFWETLSPTSLNSSPSNQWVFNLHAWFHWIEVVVRECYFLCINVGKNSIILMSSSVKLLINLISVDIHSKHLWTVLHSVFLLIFWDSSKPALFSCFFYCRLESNLFNPTTNWKVQQYCFQRDLILRNIFW